MLGVVLIGFIAFTIWLNCPSKILLRRKAESINAEAIYTAMSCGPTTSDNYTLYVVKAGQNDFKESDAVFNATNAENIQIRWINQFLVVSYYEGADIRHFRNSIWVDNVGLIHILLVDDDAINIYQNLSELSGRKKKWGALSFP